LFFVLSKSSTGIFRGYEPFNEHRHEDSNIFLTLSYSNIRSSYINVTI